MPASTLRSLFTSTRRGCRSTLRTLGITAVLVAAGVTACGHSASFTARHHHEAQAAVHARLDLAANRIRLMTPVMFEHDSAKLELGSFEVLDDVARILALHPEILDLEISGHTSSEGSDQYNRELSERRAEAVRDYLMRKAVNPLRAVAAGYGERYPVVDNRTEEGRAKNRRVEFHICRRLVAGRAVVYERPYGWPSCDAPRSNVTGSWHLASARSSRCRGRRCRRCARRLGMDPFEVHAEPFTPVSATRARLDPAQAWPSARPRRGRR